MPARPGDPMTKSYPSRTIAILFVVVGIVGMASLFLNESSWAQQRKFERKDCLDCHQKFAEKYLSRKSVHSVVKAGKCEDCHLRHGIVPKAILKKQGNDLCLACHPKEKVGLSLPHVHTALRKSRCTSCHDPHASQGSHLLKAEGPEACYQCHAKEPYQRKVVHAVLQKEGCRTCHLSHGSAQENLLTRAKTPLCLSCHDPGKGT